MECTDCSFKSEIQRSVCGKEDCIGVFCSSCREVVGKHVVCKECKQRLTCYRTFMCETCPMLTWITPDVAIGSATAPDSTADTVVDLNYPNNSCPKGEIQTRGNVIYLGVWNLFSLEELADKILDTLSGRILFRCRKGFNKSVAMACLYLRKTMPILDAYRMITLKRPRVSYNFRYQVALLREVKLEGKKLLQYNTKRFLHACNSRDLEQIRKLATTVDINHTRFKGEGPFKSPLVVSLEYDGDTEVTELLLSLGAVVTPYDAYHIHSLIGVDYPLSYLDFFKERGYDLAELRSQFRGLEEESEEEDLL